MSYSPSTRVPEPIYKYLPDTSLLTGSSAAQGPRSGTWATANSAIFMPFYLTEPKTLDKITVSNGTVASGNIDVGIYDSAGVKIVTGGATAQTGTSANQTINLTDTALAAKTLYYAAVVMDNTTGTFLHYGDTLAGAPGNILGIREVAASYVLPASVTYAALGAGGKPPIIRLEFTA